MNALQFKVDLGSGPSFTVETLEVTLRYGGEGNRHVFLSGAVPNEFLSWPNLACSIEVEGLEAVAPEPFHRMKIVLISGDMPQIDVTIRPGNVGDRTTYFRVGMFVPARQGWNVGVDFSDAAPEAHVRLRITKRAL